jgi:hypothetical protein
MRDTHELRLTLVASRGWCAGEEHLRKSGVAYTVVRPGGLTSSPAGEAQIVAGATPGFSHLKRNHPLKCSVDCFARIYAAAKYWRGGHMLVRF